MFPTNRGEVRRWDSKEEYLRGRAGNHVESPRLCHAIARANANVGEGYAELGVPWPTLVLGSGCLDTPDSPGRVRVGDLPTRVAGYFAGQPFRDDVSDQDSMSPDLVAYEFVASLVKSRIPGTKVDSTEENAAGNSPKSEPGQDWAAELALGAALMTDLYHVLCSSQHLSFTAHRGQDVLYGSGTDSVEALWCASRAAAQLEFLSGHGALRDPEQVTRAWVTGLLARLSHRVQSHRGKIALADVELITDLAWYYLTEHSGVYPGWSDLLIELTMSENQEPGDGRLRPTVNPLTGAAVPLAKRFQEVTDASWLSWRDTPLAERTSRQRFYAAAARVLIEQSRFRRGRRGLAVPASACAFVTTFDLELEMALWHCGVDAFLMAVPVTVVARLPGRDNLDLGSNCWLGAIITRPDGGSADASALKAITASARWFVLDDADTSWDPNLPVVVRLSGSPLLHLPEIEPGMTLKPEEEALRARLIHKLGLEGMVSPVKSTAADSAGKVSRKLVLQHAVLLDEYAAMRHVAADFTQIESKERPIRGGLPASITDFARSRHPRFWMAMGVQVSDTVVRNRLSSQMFAPLWMGNQSAARGDAMPAMAGLVVNKRVDMDAFDLLYWSGCDVVVDVANEEFTEELDHYADHLKKYSRDMTNTSAITKTGPDVACEIRPDRPVGGGGDR